MRYCVVCSVRWWWSSISCCRYSCFVSRLDDGVVVLVFGGVGWSFIAVVDDGWLLVVFVVIVGWLSVLLKGTLLLVVVGTASSSSDVVSSLLWPFKMSSKAVLSSKFNMFSISPSILL